MQLLLSARYQDTFVCARNKQGGAVVEGTKFALPDSEGHPPRVRSPAYQPYLSIFSCPQSHNIHRVLALVAG